MNLLTPTLTELSQIEICLGRDDAGCKCHDGKARQIKAHQMKIGFNIKAADGTKIRDTIWNTVHVVPKK